MRFGVSLFPLRPQQLVDVALKAEELGYDSVWLGEHVITPVESNSRYPYSTADEDSHKDFHAKLPFYDPYAVLSHLAALTKTLKLAVSVSIVPLHDPFHLARSVTTLDLFSNGRFLFGMGSGWLSEEFEIMGRDFETRGKRLDESIDVMLSLFRDSVTEYKGNTLSVPPISMVPKPQTKPHPPFIFGGHAKVALRRAAERGDGWLASEAKPQEVAKAVEALREMRKVAGRSELPFEISCSVPGEIEPEMVQRYAEAGVDRLVVRPWRKGRDALASITQMAKSLEIRP